nr:relaxase/mobilization nuclease domain-containing protein [Moraxella sp. CTOTU48717]
MLVKFFKRGGVTDNHYSSGGRAVQRYLLGKDYADGIASRENAKLLSGNPEWVTELINGLTFSKIYTAGCLAFEGEESKTVTEAMKQQLMDEFEHCLFTGLDKNQYAGYWVEHTDKIDEVTNTPRLELNFVFANVELTTGKALPVYYHLIDEKRVDTFKEIKNLEMNLTDPVAAARIKLTRIGDKLPKNVKETLGKINDELEELFINESVNHRDDVITYLSEHYEITAIKNQSISIKNPHGGARPIRLQGAFYEKTFESRGTLGEQFDQAKNDRRYREEPDHERILRLKADYQSYCDKRSNELSKRFKNRAQNRAEPTVEPDQRVEQSLARTYRYIDRPEGYLSPFRSARYAASPDGRTDHANRREGSNDFNVTHESGGQQSGYLRQSREREDSIENRERAAGLPAIFKRTANLAQQADNEYQPPESTTSDIVGDLFKPAGDIVGHQHLGARRMADLVNIHDNIITDDSVYSDLLRDLPGVSTVNAGELNDATEPSKPTVRDRLSAAVKNLVRRATSAVYGFQTAVRARQSSVERISGLAQTCYGEIRKLVNHRYEQRTRHQNTARQFTGAKSAVSRSSRTLSRAISKPVSRASTNDSSVDQPSISASPVQSGTTNTNPAIAAVQPATDNGKSSDLSQVVRMGHAISSTGRQNDNIDKTIELIAQRQAVIAEEARLAKLKQQLEARTEFEKQIAEEIKAYFNGLQQAKIEADYYYERYSLNRALQAMIALRVSQVIGDKDMFLKATTAYKRAMVGVKPTHDRQEMIDKARDGSIGFSEKIRSKGLDGLGYQKDKPAHCQYLAQGVKLATLLNNQAKALVDQAIERDFIESDQTVELYDADRQLSKPLTSLFDDIDKILTSVDTSVQSPKPVQQPSPSYGRRRGPGF